MDVAIFTVSSILLNLNENGAVGMFAWVGAEMCWDAVTIHSVLQSADSGLSPDTLLKTLSMYLSAVQSMDHARILS